MVWGEPDNIINSKYILDFLCVLPLHRTHWANIFAKMETIARVNAWSAKKNKVTCTSLGRIISVPEGLAQKR